MIDLPPNTFHGIEGVEHVNGIVLGGAGRASHMQMEVCRICPQNDWFDRLNIGRWWPRYPLWVINPQIHRREHLIQGAIYSLTPIGVL